MKVEGGIIRDSIHEGGKPASRQSAAGLCPLFEVLPLDHDDERSRWEARKRGSEGKRLLAPAPAPAPFSPSLSSSFYVS